MSRAHQGAFRKGVKAAEDGKPRTACPYDRGGEFSQTFAKAWTDGWESVKEEQMDSKLKNYLAKLPPAKVDKAAMAVLEEEMKDAATEITENIRRREKLAAEARLGLTEVNARLDALERRLDALQGSEGE